MEILNHTKLEFVHQSLEFIVDFTFATDFVATVLTVPRTIVHPSSILLASVQAIGAYFWVRSIGELFCDTTSYTLLSYNYYSSS
jgi:hypothetical protein